MTGVNTSSLAANDGDDQLPASTVMILLDRPFDINSEELSDILSKSLPPGSFQIDGGLGGGAVLTLAGNKYALLTIDAPIPQETFDIQLNYGMGDQSKPTAAARNHKAHLIISAVAPSKEFGEALFKAVNVMNIGFLLGDGHGAIGAYWSGSEYLVHWDAYLAYVDTAIRSVKQRETNLLPIDFWSGFRLKESSSGKIGGFTIGLHPFVGYEVYIDPVDWSQNQVAEMLLNITHYSLQSGPVLKDGDTVPFTDSQQFRITRAIPLQGPPEHHLVLEEIAAQ